MTISLQGVTWNHSRGYLPMVATAQRFAEMVPGFDVVWEKRFLERFGENSIERLADRFDFFVVDHSSIGEFVNRDLLTPLDEHLPKDFMEDQARHSVGKSCESYQWENHQWALAIDAAAPVSARRTVLLEQSGLTAPKTWKELLSLARRGWVAVPGDSLDCLLNFYMLCSSLGEDPFSWDGNLVSQAVGAQALSMLRELMNLCPEVCYSWDPVATFEAMASHDNIGYCPFAFGYANYARSGYASYRLHFDELVTLDEHGPLRSTLGGKGLAISSRCQHLQVALEYARYVASPGCQRGLYFESGGQPGHRKAWLDKTTNLATLDFFQTTLAALDRAYLRPRYSGYLQFQRDAGLVVQGHLQAGGDPNVILKRLQELYDRSRVS
jgi:multiple sugar transport system substrate-binding protein